MSALFRRWITSLRSGEVVLYAPPDMCDEDTNDFCEWLAFVATKVREQHERGKAPAVGDSTAQSLSETPDRYKSKKIKSVRLMRAWDSVLMSERPATASTTEVK